MTGEECRERFASARVARLATVTPGGAPHLVPITFALRDERTIVTAVDHKPKRTTALQRLTNITAEPRVAVITDHYDDRDWERLWWVRAEGRAHMLQRPDERSLDALAERYEQYRSQRPTGPLIVIAVERFSGWRAA